MSSSAMHQDPNLRARLSKVSSASEMEQLLDQLTVTRGFLGGRKYESKVYGVYGKVSLNEIVKKFQEIPHNTQRDALERIVNRIMMLDTQEPYKPVRWLNRAIGNLFHDRLQTFSDITRETNPQYSEVLKIMSTNIAEYVKKSGDTIPKEQLYTLITSLTDPQGDHAKAISDFLTTGENPANRIDHPQRGQREKVLLEIANKFYSSDNNLKDIAESIIINASKLDSASRTIKEILTGMKKTTATRTALLRNALRAG